ncbi:hypothetical protein MMC19_004789 [Ptychographa xylographoides]|nr:hypothetical protein [Ptychographa xylographoides]
MALVGYSDSEDSDETPVPTSKTSQKSNIPSKPSFQKVIDRSYPHKIKVTLPEASKTAAETQEDGDEPPVKRAKLGPAAFSGFNSMLPAPKRVTGGEATNTKLRKGGLGSGVNLKTGAAPAFSREPMYPTEADDSVEAISFGSNNGSVAPDFGSIDAETRMKSDDTGAQETKQEPKKQGNAMMFKPLSVAKKSHKQKNKNSTVFSKPPTDSVSTPKDEIIDSTAIKPLVPSKVSLFSMGGSEKDDPVPAEDLESYQPLVFQTTLTDDNDTPLPESTESDGYNVDPAVTTTQPPAFTTLSDLGPQSLDSIAADLKLSASAKRQLFGRQHNSSRNGPTSAINIVNFNTDQEYAANEILRQAGEQVQHNPVRVIAAGKHSLKQLVNAASNQKDALEEQFASGRRNRKEAGSKYGW